ncbi:hypothetical protein MKW94_018716 [Papaver nudicaule]|uniref:Fe2OG dioxygenase domain-containing protein n=1 Tax=Papaver nudicaule TaxID=74823 RepID=A0AA41S5P3_PAPNU|nr:hypothetical protein [Papaver nudicaule]
MDGIAFDFERESDVLEFVVKKGHGVKGLADTGLTTVPPKYIHSPSERIDRKDTIDSTPFLCAPFDISALLEEGDVDNEKKREVSKKSVNHGVSHEVMENAKRAAHIFFNLPRERKLAYSKENSPLLLSLTPFAYLKSANKMILGMLSALLKGLDVEIDKSTIRSCTDAKTINMNFFPPCPNPDLTVGIGRHSDISALTILLQDDVGGLFVKAQDKGWIEIPPLKDALVINIGDTLEILSNGRYKSAEHRALASKTRARVSVPIFVSPIPPTTIGPLPGLAEKDGKAVYRQVLFREYKKQYFGNIHQGKATLDFAKALLPQPN